MSAPAHGEDVHVASFRHALKVIPRSSGDQDAPLYVRMEAEPGASGAGLVSHYQRNVLPRYDFAGVRPSGPKVTCVAPVASLAEAGHLYLVRAPWNDSFLDELCAFPLVGHDDQVDALSGAFHCLVEASEEF